MIITLMITVIITMIITLTKTNDLWQDQPKLQAGPAGGKGEVSPQLPQPANSFLFPEFFSEYLFLNTLYFFSEYF